MKSFLLSLLLLPSLHSILAQQPSPSPEQPISRKLAIKVPGKISSVTLSIQKSVCLVQLESPGFLGGEPEPKNPASQVWLLKADGTAIPQSSKPNTITISNGGAVTPCIIYTFPRSAATDALAVVVSVEGQLFVEALASKPK
jgi:hypothetical protein